MEEEDLFDPLRPRSTAAVEEKGDDAPVAEAAQTFAGFGGAKTAFSVPIDARGRAQLCLQCALLSEPLHSPDGPVLFWEGRQFFYRLGYAKKLLFHKWLGVKGNRLSIDRLLDWFDVDKESNFRPSRKQMFSQLSALDLETLTKMHDVEIMASTAWCLVFLYLLIDSSAKVIRINAFDMLRQFCALGDKPVPVLEAGGENLPECLTPHDEHGNCIHMSSLYAQLTQKFGPQWRKAHTAEFLFFAPRGECAALDLLIYQVFWQITVLIEDTTPGYLPPTCEGMPVLAGSSRSRRLTKHWTQHPTFGLKTTGTKDRVFSESVSRDTHSAVRHERHAQCQYHGDLAQHVATASHVCIAPDGVSAPGDTANIAVTLPLVGVSGWLPLQV